MRLILVVLLACWAVAVGAQEPPGGGGCAGESLRELFPNQKADTVILRVGLLAAADDGGDRPVAFDHAFVTGDRARLQVRASRAGSICLVQPDATGKPRALWPATGLAYSLAAETDVIFPGGTGIRFTGEPQDEQLNLIFSSDTTGCPPVAQRAIIQIRLRTLEVDDTVCRFFVGKLDKGPATIELTLRHHDSENSENSRSQTAEE